MSYLSRVLVIARKDLVLEFRTRERLAAMGAFAVLAAALFSFAIDAGTTRAQTVASALIWMTLVFSGLLGVGRTFYLERQDGGLQGILTSPTPKDALFLGKVLANFVLLFVVSLIVLGVFTLFFALELGPQPLAVVAVLALGSAGFVALSTLFAGVTSSTTMGETLLPILVFPLLLPMVIYGAGATGRLMAGRPFAEVAGNVRMLAAFALMAVTAGAILFRFVVED